ncbi:MAG: sugar transferase, partial [Patescibacteria group bacterium]
YGASVEAATEKMQYDLYYIKNRSFLLEVSIILKTITVILSRQGR